MLKLKKGDTVQAIKGKDRGKKGKILKIVSANGRALVEGINMVKKHKRRTQTDQKGGVVAFETPISISNLAFVCGHCNRAVRLGFMILKDGTKSRVCKSCNEVI